MRKILVASPSLIPDPATSFLSRNSFRLRTATSADDAIAVAREFRPELVVLGDTRGGSTVALCEALRALDASIKLLAIVSSPDMATEMTELVDLRLLQPKASQEIVTAIGMVLDIKSRAAPRLETELLAQVSRSVPQAQSALANILGLSSTGVSLELQERLVLGDVYDITFSLPGCTAPIACKVCVLRVDELLFHYGCEFMDCNDLQRSAIAEFVHESDFEVS